MHLVQYLSSYVKKTPFLLFLSFSQIIRCHRMLSVTFLSSTGYPLGRFFLIIIEWKTLLADLKVDSRPSTIAYGASGQYSA